MVDQYIVMNNELMNNLMLAWCFTYITFHSLASQIQMEHF